MECLKCNRRMAKTEPYITCCDCKRVAHPGCTRLTAEEVKLHRERRAPWRCRACTKQKELFKEGFRKRSRVQEKGMGDSHTDHFSKDLEQKRNVYKSIIEGDSAVSKVDAPPTASGALHSLLLRNERLAKEVETLGYRLDIAEQNTKRNTVEICGVPDKKNENLLTVAKQIGSAIDYPLRDEMVDTCYRINRQNKNGIHNIALTFVRRFDKEGFLKCYRQKRGLSTKDIGRKEDSLIYIRESLSLNKQLIFLEARKLAKQMNYQGVGVINGEVFVKKSESIPAILVRDLRDLEKLINPNKLGHVK